MLWNESGLVRAFSGVGADLRLATLTAPSRRQPVTQPYTLDVETLSRSPFERYVLSIGDSDTVDAQVLHALPAQQHLLLLVKSHDRDGQLKKSRFLCGHDERHWFVAAVPDKNSPSRTVQQAMDALQPSEVQQALRRGHVRHKQRHRRNNPAYLRQGEWFFLPAPDFEADPRIVHRREPLRMFGKPHWVEELVRTGGDTVYVCRQQPSAVSVETHRRMLQDNPAARYWSWRQMKANPQVHARGRVWHPDHASVYLPFWHRVLPNEEAKALSRPQVVFLD